MQTHLLVGEDKQHGIPQLVLVQHSMQLVARLLGTIPVVAVHDEDQGLGIQVVMAPERSDPILATDVPDCEIDVLVLDGLNIETDGRYRGDVLTQLQLVQYGSLACRIQSDHEDADVSFGDEALEDTCEVAHGKMFDENFSTSIFLYR